MKGRKLPHYDAYRVKLEVYAKAAKIVVVDSDADEGSSSIHRRRVYIGTDLSQSHEVATFLHELGHLLDDCFHKPATARPLSKAYGRLYSRQAVGRKQRNLVMACERRAWDYGRAIAKLLRIPLGKWYDEFRAECLASYRK